MAAVLLLSLSGALAPSFGLAASTTPNLDQCANGSLAVPSSSCDWQNGNLNQNQAHYLEGQSIPYRLVMPLLTTGDHSVKIEWDTLKNGKHALDFITSWDRSAPSGADPLAGVSGVPAGSPATFPISDPCGPSYQLGGQVFTLYGGTISSVVYSDGGGGDAPRDATITFNVPSGGTAVLLWGGHIARHQDWGIGQSAASITGSPFHTRLLDLDGSGGNQDRALSTEATYFPAELTIVKQANPEGSLAFAFAGSPAMADDAAFSSFSLTDNGTAANTANFSTLSWTNYTVTETVPAGWSLTGATCTGANGSGDPITPGSLNGSALSFPLNEGDVLTCTFNDLMANVNPVLTTTATASVTVGQAIHDVAHLSGGYGTLGGTISFDVYAPSDNTCTTPLTPQPTGNNVTGAGDYTSGDFTTSEVGDYHWIAHYSGAGFNNALDTSCGDSNEASTVGKATPALTTTASGPVTVGMGITDTAHLSGGYGTLGGTITFDVFAPGDNTCSSPLSPRPSGKSVTGAGDYTSGSFTTSQVGDYRWTAHYSGDANNNAVNTACNDANESSATNKATPTLTTTATTSVTVGQAIKDTAHLSAGFAPLGGTISFDVFAPGDNTCSSPLSPAPSSATVSGAGNYDSGNFTTTAVGTYRWIAHYSGDANNNAVNTACNDTGESSTTVKATPDITTTAMVSATVGQPITDTAHLSGGYGTLGGSVSFDVFAPGDNTCSSPLSPQPTGKTVTGAGNYTSGGFVTSQVGEYHWTAHYSGDANNVAVNTACNDANESSVTLKATPLLTTTATSAVTVGQAIKDTAHLSAGFAPLGGTISFDVFAPGDNTCSSPLSPAPSSATVSGAGNYDSGNFTTTAVGTYRWIAHYSGDSNNNGVSTACGEAGESSAAGKATPALTTTATVAVTVGQPIIDTAHLSGGYAPLGGSVTFDVFAPGDTTCSSPLSPAPTGGAVSGAGNYPSGPFTTTQVGDYRWIAHYSGDANNIAVNTACNDANESTVTNKATPTLTTTAVQSVTVGQPISDTAHLGGGYGTLGGTISFDVFAPGDNTCSSPLSPAPTSASVSGAGNYDSGNFTTTQVGEYHWIAHYSGDTNNNAVSTACGDLGESSTAVKASPSLTTTASGSVIIGQEINDTAHLSGGYGTLGGSISFQVFAPADATCSSALTPAPAGATVSGAGNYPSGSFTTAAVGTYRWIAHYTGDARNNGADTACNDPGESVVVTKATPAITTDASGPVIVGQAITDTAHLTGGYGTLGGTVSFKVFGPGDDSCSSPLSPVPTAATVDGVGYYPSGSFTTTQVGEYRWLAHYSGDGNNNVVDSLCSDPAEVSTVGLDTPNLTTTASGPVTVGMQIHDTAHLSGGYGNLGGTISFDVFAPGDNTCSSPLSPAPTSAEVDGAGNYDSGNFNSNQAGEYRWIAHYSGDANNNAVSTACNDENESSATTKATPTLTTTATTSAMVGETINDVAHLSGGFGTPSGTITFEVFGPGDNTCASPLTPAVEHADAIGSGDYASGDFVTTLVGEHRWIAHYSGDANNNAVDTACNDAHELSTVLAKPVLIVIKHVINNDGGTNKAADFTMVVKNNDTTMAGFPGAEAPGVKVTVQPGTYDVSETGSPTGYTMTNRDQACSGTIAAGQTKVCTIVNDDNPRGAVLAETGRFSASFLLGLILVAMGVMAIAVALRRPRWNA